MTSPDICGHCKSTNVEKHCIGGPTCSWSRCQNCGWISDSNGHAYDPNAKKAA